MAPQMAEVPARALLEGVPPIGLELVVEGRCPEDMPFASCLRASLEYLGEQCGRETPPPEGQAWRPYCLYGQLLSTSGAAFQLVWQPANQPAGLMTTFLFHRPTEAIRHAFQSVGHDCEIVLPQEGRDNHTYFRDRIVDSIGRRRRPVLGFGIVGKPDCCLISGYEDYGDTIVGSSLYQLTPEPGATQAQPAGLFRQRDWWQRTHGLILIGEQRERPPLRQVCRQALAWALEVVRPPEVVVWDRPCPNGLAAYEAWAQSLSDDSLFPPCDMSVLWGHYLAHEEAMDAVAEGRWYGAQFLHQMAAGEPSVAEHLTAAADCYEAENDLMLQIWGLVGGPGHAEKHARRLAEPEMRRQVALLIRLARDRDAQAADQLEKALEKLRP